VRAVLRWAGRLALGLLLVAVSLLAPVAYVEVACRGTPVAGTREPLVAPEHRRAEARTVMTYPEWHIVYAYEDYAATIRAGDPHDYRFLPEIRRFWRSACVANRASAALGGADWTARQTIHVIGVSFTAEMLLKALYEETVGRAATWVRGGARAPLDDLSAGQAAAYADFLHQTPWYRWDFARDAAALEAARTGALRDRERALALGIEYGVKGTYARAIGAAVAATGADRLTMRSVVAGLSPEELEAVEGVAVIAERPEGVEVETPRYEAFDRLARDLAARGATFVEVAGNDQIMITAITLDEDAIPGEILRLPRQGEGGWRHLLLLPVSELAAALAASRLDVEHVHDY
jgi:hypothetical protein